MWRRLVYDAFACVRNVFRVAGLSFEAKPNYELLASLLRTAVKTATANGQAMFRVQGSYPQREEVQSVMAKYASSSEPASDEVATKRKGGSDANDEETLELIRMFDVNDVPFSCDSALHSRGAYCTTERALGRAVAICCTHPSFRSVQVGAGARGPPTRRATRVTHAWRWIRRGHCLSARKPCMNG